MTGCAIQDGAMLSDECACGCPVAVHVRLFDGTVHCAVCQRFASLVERLERLERGPTPIAAAPQSFRHVADHVHRVADSDGGLILTSDGHPAHTHDVPPAEHWRGDGWTLVTDGHRHRVTGRVEYCTSLPFLVDRDRVDL